jgi:hypothetical protein
MAKGIVAPPHTAVPLQVAASLPEATMGVRIGDSSEALLVLATYEGGNLWLGGTQVSVVTHNGRIVQTVGLEHDLTKLSAIADQAFEPLAIANGREVHTKWMADIADLKVFSASLECDARPVRGQRIVILGKTIETEKVEETCSCASLGWTFTNNYWISPTSGLVWMSVQHVHPNLDPVTTELLRPPAVQQ